MANRFATSVQGQLHFLPSDNDADPPISAFEPRTSTTPDESSSTLIWIGGLFDTYHSVRYPYTLASRLPSHWSLVQISLSSSGHGWGHSSLDQDAKEIARAVTYFRSLRSGGRIVVMGHSTGCQDGIHYLVSSNTGQGDLSGPGIDGLILQAPVSDREAPPFAAPETKKLAQEWMEQGKGDDCLPLTATKGVMGNCPVTAYRWLSLSSVGGDDDYFSSDLSDQRLRNTFGKFPAKTPLLVLSGENDEYVKPGLDVESMLKRWVGFVKEGGGIVDPSSERVLKGASHNLNNDPDSVVDELCSRVVNFLSTVEHKRTE